jgi:uncharacterized membrane protein YcfT
MIINEKDIPRVVGLTVEKMSEIYFDQSYLTIDETVVIERFVEFIKEQMNHIMANE